MDLKDKNVSRLQKQIFEFQMDAIIADLPMCLTEIKQHLFSMLLALKGLQKTGMALKGHF